MATVFLSYPVRDTTEDDIQRIRDVMMTNYNAVNGEHNTYATTHDNLWSDSLYYLGESLQHIDRADVVLMHPDWLKDIGCSKEAELAELYDKKIVYLNETIWDLDYFIWSKVSPVVYAKIKNFCKERSIWTKELFAKIDISEFKKVNGIGPLTIRTFRDLQKEIREEFNG